MKQVKGHRYLYRRGEHLVFRRSVPERARAAFGKTEVQVSLGTGTVADARHLLARELEKFDRRMADVTGVRSPAAVLDIATREPTAEELEAGVRLWFSERLDRMKDEVDTLHDQRRAAELSQNYAAVSASAAAALGIGGESTIMTDWIVEALTERFNWRVGASTQLHRRLQKLISRGQMEVARRFRQEANGDPVRVTDGTFSPEQYWLDEERRRNRINLEPISLMALFDGYIRERKPAQATIKAWRRQLSAFVTYVGHDDATKVTPDDIVSWKDHLLHKAGQSGTGLSAKTVGETYLSALKTTFRWAVDNRKIPSNPAEKIRVRGAKKVLNRERGLTDREADTILAATLTEAPHGLSPERALARRWVPWICAYTGARVNEITQLRSQDVLCVDGLWVIRITPEAGPIKTSVARTVPLHPHLVEQGFPNVAASRNGYLFFDPMRRRRGTDAHPQSKKVGEFLARWVREIGVDDPDVQPNHGWRHRFKTVSRNVRMNPEIRDRMQGHAPRTEGEGYGDVSLPAMLREIELLPRYRLVPERP